MRTPLTFNRLLLTLRSPLTIYHRKRKTENGKRTVKGKLKTVNSSGDTLVEVMLSIVLIGSAVTLAVTMSNHNLNVGIGTTQRSQALSITQGQIERIRNAYNTNNPVLETYKSDQAYCILNDGAVEQVGAQDSKCTNFNGTPYSISITYSDASKVFSATTSWVSNSSGSGQDQLKLSYKLPS